MKDIQDSIRYNFDSIKKKLQLEVHNATFHLKDSYFDDSSSPIGVNKEKKEIKFKTNALNSIVKTA